MELTTIFENYRSLFIAIESFNFNSNDDRFSFTLNLNI